MVWEQLLDGLGGFGDGLSKGFGWSGDGGCFGDGLVMDGWAVLEQILDSCRMFG